MAVGLGGFAGGFASTGLAVSVLEGDGPMVSGGEKARLEVLSIIGMLVSVFGYGSLMLFGGFVALISPLRDLQLG